MTGLAADGQSAAAVSFGLLLQPPAPARDAFAQATRLTPAEVDGLCLRSLRYPLPTPAQDRRWSAFRARADRWVLAPATRYCPHCLAGDPAAAIQRVHGGPWRKAWHLPVVFACTDHQRLLEHRCPACRQPVHGSRPGRPATLLPRMRDAALHPVQCRTRHDPAGRTTRPPACGTRLDLAPAAGDGMLGDRLLDLQRHLLGLLRADAPATASSAGLATEPGRYFTDLRLLTALVCATWPVCRPMAPSPALAAAIDDHVQQQRQAVLLQAQQPKTRLLRVLDAPPADAAACAALLAIAAAILSLASPEAVRERLRSLLPDSSRQARRTPWALCSPAPASASTPPQGSGRQSSRCCAASPARLAGRTPVGRPPPGRCGSAPSTFRRSCPQPGTTATSAT